MKKLFVLFGLVLGMALYAQPGSPDANGTITPGSPWVTGIPSGGGEMELQLDYIYNQGLENKDSITAYATDFTTGALNVTGDADVYGRFTEHPYGIIDLGNYTDASQFIHFQKAYKYQHGEIDISPTSGAWQGLYGRADTINLMDDFTLFYGDYNYNWLNSEIHQSGSNYWMNRDYFNQSNFIAPAATMTFKYNVNGFYPVGYDSIEIKNHDVMLLSFQSHTPDVTSNVDIGEQKLLHVDGVYDDHVSIDSLSAIYIELRNTGVLADSVRKVFAIKNVDSNVRGADNTYFLYSEFGDNYLNGELEVTGGIKQTQISAALTDNTPTDAEIDAATGTTPAAAGAGWSVTILDTSGSELLYRVESDGTNWQYQVLTIAL